MLAMAAFCWMLYTWVFRPSPSMVVRSGASTGGIGSCRWNGLGMLAEDRLLADFALTEDRGTARAIAPKIPAPPI
jgi:hypothetical protein